MHSNKFMITSILDIFGKLSMLTFFRTLVFRLMMTKKILGKKEIFKNISFITKLFDQHL